MVDWEIRGEELAKCSCNSGCASQFSELPIDGTSEVAVVYKIQKGYYGKPTLNALTAAGGHKCPGATHEVNGHMQLTIAPKANQDQRAALDAVVTGAEVEEVATMWFVFGVMCPHKHPTICGRNLLELNLEDWVGNGVADGVFNMYAEPIPNIVTGEPHSVGIALPNGFEFGFAEMAKWRTKTTNGNLDLTKNTGTRGHMASLLFDWQGSRCGLDLQQAR